jgi:hypothetical protein
MASLSSALALSRLATARLIAVLLLIAYSGDVNDRFQRDVNRHSGDVNKVGAQRRWDYNHARYLRH